MNRIINRIILGALGMLLGAIPCISQTVGSSSTIYLTSNGTSGGSSILPSGFATTNMNVWDGIGCSWDGQIYYTVTNGQVEAGNHNGNAAVFHYNPYTSQFVNVGTLKGAAQAANNWMTNESQEKIHAAWQQVYTGEMWAGSHDNSDDNYNYWHRGPHWYAITPDGGTLVDKSADQASGVMLSATTCTSWRQTHNVVNPKITPTDSTGVAVHYEALMGSGYNPQAPYLMYGCTYPRTLIVQHNLLTKITRVVGSGRDVITFDANLWSGVSRCMTVDKFGNAYVPGRKSSGGYQVTKYDYALDSSYVIASGTSGSGTEWVAATRTWSGESLFVKTHEGEIYGFYSGQPEMHYIATVGGYGPNLLVNRSGTYLYTIRANNTNIFKVNIATGAVTTFGSVPSAGYPYSHNTYDTLGYAYYAFGGRQTDRGTAMFKVYYGKNELGPYTQPIYSGIDEQSVAQTNRKPQLTCYPNPFSGEIGFEIRNSGDKAGDLTVAIYDLKGSLVYSNRMTMEKQHTRIPTWNGRSLSGAAVVPGIYVVRVKTPNEAFHQKIVKAF